MYIIDNFSKESPHLSLCGQKKAIIIFVSIDQILKKQIFHMVASEHPQTIEERQQLISKYILDPDEAAKGCSIDDDGDASY